MSTLIKNARIVTPYEILDNHAVVVRDGKIYDIAKSGEHDADSFGEVIDAGGKFLSPGFIDIHNHGNFGHDAMEATFDALASMARFHLLHGVTGFLAATMTASYVDIRRAVKNVGDYIQKQGGNFSASDCKENPGAQLFGIYLEGPYFSMSKKGAQPPEYIKNPDIGELEDLIEVSGNNIKVVALAPELPGATEAISYLKSRGVTVSAAHTDATYDEAVNGIEHGITQVTHVFNGMRSFSHREPGIVGAALTDERVYCEMICDGIHLHPAVMKLAAGIKGRNKIILISDAMMACGLSDGEYELGGQKVFVKSKAARLADGTLAGSTLTLDRAIHNMVHMVGVALCDAVRMATLNPARAIGLSHRKGSIEMGKDADLVIFDENINISMVMTMGKLFKPASK
ncbi:MAG: N-acetylglucosamine-6-phosphate deacetylase [Tepidanaerobacteraceae bacterium]|jgi:N-acetylglucosamine-6-phosphate deacetylase|nr:N-acetylglucosamine-6-phosphate deacetylase [Tepidanaerobacteraceae bacterium]